MDKKHDVMILAGGKGTRLAELTSNSPKGLVFIGDKPILWHIMTIFASQGYKRFVLCLGHMSNQIIDYFSNKNNINPEWEIVFDDLGPEAQKSARIKSALDHIKTEAFFLAYGDDLANVNLAELKSCAQETDSIVTMTAVKPKSQYGVLHFNGDKQITSIAEKPKSNNWINGGFMLISIEILNHLNLGELEDDVIPALIKLNTVSAYKHSGFWLAMNNYKEFLELENIYKENILSNSKLPWIR
jgi:glucose-1-phosphate cytidylyltransferase